MARAIAKLCAAVAAEGLPGAVAPVVPSPLGDIEFDALVANATAERVTGHLIAAVEDGTVAVTEEQYERAADRHEDMLAMDLVLERRLVETSARFSDAGIAHRALKGPVVARTAYPDPALRSFGDIDILVEATRFDDTVALLVADGSRARYEQPRPGFTSRFGKGVCVVADSGLEIDLHRVFVSGPFGLAIDTADLFAEPASIPIADASIPTLSPTLQFVHTCYHAALGARPPRLTALRDVAQLASSVHVDVTRALETASRWRGRAVLQRALDLARAGLPARLEGPLYDWSDRYVGDRFERSALTVYATDDASYAAQAATGLWAIHGYRARVAYASALLFPERAYMQEREGTYRQRVRRAVGLARRWRPRP